MAECDDSREPSGALARLLELEQDVARRLADARETSERAIREAKDAVQRRQAERARETDEAVRALHARLDAEHQAELGANAARADADADRYDRIDEATVAALTNGILDDLLRLTTPRGRT